MKLRKEEGNVYNRNAVGKLSVNCTCFLVTQDVQPQKISVEHTKISKNAITD